jgi:hypothetical protein
MRPTALFFLATIAVISRAEAQEGGSHDLPGIIIGNDKNKGSDNDVAPVPPTPAPAPKNSSSGGGKPSGGGGAANGPGAASCTGKESDPSEAMRCLNQQMKGQADKVNPTMSTPPIDAKSGDTKIGVVNIPGVQQQYGKNFGVSAAPFRPAAPTFTRPPTPPPTNLGTAPVRTPNVGVFHR